MNNVIIDKDQLMLLINECDAIKEKKFALECLDKDPDKFIRLLFCVIDNMCEGLKTKESIIQDKLRECNDLNRELNETKETIRRIRNNISEYSGEVYYL